MVATLENNLVERTGNRADLTGNRAVSDSIVSVERITFLQEQEPVEMTDAEIFARVRKLKASWSDEEILQRKMLGEIRREQLLDSLMESGSDAERCTRDGNG